MASANVSFVCADIGGSISWSQLFETRPENYASAAVASTDL